MNREVRYSDVKKNNKVLINVRFYGDDDVYLPIYATALPVSKAEMKKYGSYESDEDETGEAEFCRINLTKWKMVGAPKEILPLVKHLVGETLWLYFNGAECAWKFFDPDGDCDKKNRGLCYLKTDEELDYDELEEIQVEYENKCYAPHCDSDGNYGDESVHAVYYDLVCEDSESEDDELDDTGPYIEHAHNKISVARNLIDKINVSCEEIFIDLCKKRNNHKRIKVDSKMLNEIRSYVNDLYDKIY